MDLNHIKLNGFKRFEKVTLNTSGKIIALLGPNEAGKSSILEALTCLNNDNPFNPDLQLTRNKHFTETDIVIEAVFFLDDKDKEAISNFDSLSSRNSFKKFCIQKQVSGKRLFEIQPFLSKLDRTNEITIVDKNTQSDLLNIINEQSREQLQEIINILKSRIPKFLLFSEEDRNLKSSFNISTSEKIPPNKALANLLKIADLDIKELRQLKNYNIIKTKQNLANKKITEIYENKWFQSEIKPIIDIDNSILKISIEEKEIQVFDIKERSDGLRQFIALINFLEIGDTEDPILLIDEAEIHLHYDAQAELINIFTEQKFASKIIYTTHSVGCLPEDLGTGVKLIFPLNENISDPDVVEKSIIKNKFWSEDKRPGVLPLLFGMGASQLTFMAIRKCVFVEGPTDMLLLPTLFRQVSQKDYLGFQIVPGIAEKAKANFGLLPNNAPKVAFLVDNDQEGEKYKKQLKESGIEPGKIFELPHQGKVIEDYICKELYLEVIHKQINNWNEGNAEMLTDISENNRPKAVYQWCKERKLKNINKVEVAYSLLDLATNERQEQLIEDSLKDDLLGLYNQIIESLNIE